MRTRITYNTKNLKMTENVDGVTAQKTFKTLEALMADKKITEEYLLKNPSDNTSIILI